MAHPPLPPSTRTKLDRLSSKRRLAAQRSTWISVIVNIFLTLGQIITGIFSGSQGLIADGIHSLSDLVGDFVVLVANHYSDQAADDSHPYGHRRFENAASLALGVLLLVVALGMCWSAGRKLLDPHLIPQVHIVALWVALAALLAKELLFRYMLYIANKVGSGMLVANAWHARSDAASSLVVALGIIGNLLGWPILDPIAALVVSLFIGRMGWKFTRDALNDLVDHAIPEEEAKQIKETLLATPGVLGVHDLLTRKMGDLIMVDVHLEVNSALSVRQGHDIALLARKRVMKAFNVINVMTHLDPVDTDSSVEPAPPPEEIPHTGSNRSHHP